MNKEQLSESKVRECGLSPFLLALFFLLFLSGCQNIFEPPKTGKPPEGTGWFLLVVDEFRMERTILPQNTLAHFAKYKVEFVNISSGVIEYKNVIVTGQWIYPDLDAQATYNLKVTAYTDEELNKVAARGESGPITIDPWVNTSLRVIIRPLMEGGEGTFSWKIDYDISPLRNIAEATMTVTQLSGGTSKTYKFTEETPKNEDEIKWNDTRSLPAGIYDVLISLVLDNSYSLEYRETLHVYTNLDSLFSDRSKPNQAYTFMENQFTYIIVTNGNDDNSLGSLRKAIRDAKVNAQYPQIPTSIIIKEGVGTIYLKERLEIDKSLTIEGSGVTIMRDPSWTDIEDKPQLLYIDGNNSKMTIRRVLFEDNWIFAEGAAIYNNADLTLESCIFSGNSNNNKNASFVYHGGAVYSKGTALRVMGCTFYGNTAGGGGGAIAVHSITNLILKGNLFYNNKQNFSSSAVYNIDINGPVTLTFGDFNVVDSVPISPPDFKPFSVSADLLFSPGLFPDYPFYDFYGKDIPDNNAAAGAVQP
jgi:predicted outer membrane repeat protein